MLLRKGKLDNWRRSRLVRDQSGQALPLLLGVMVALVAAGMLILWIALSTDNASKAQTAADAAALGAEKDVVEQLQQPWTFINGQWVPPTVNWDEARGQADSYAKDNGGKVLEFQPSTAEPWGGYDVTVIVSTINGLPAGSVDGAKHAVAEARASTDPIAQSSPSIPVSNDASVATGPRFVAHGGTFGFFPNSGANYGIGNEPEIAGRLDDFGIKQKLHIVGLVGYSPAQSAGSTSLHRCGAVSTTTVQTASGHPTNVTDKQLSDAGLERLVPAKQGQPEEIALTGTTGSSCVQGTTAPAPGSQPTPVAGNSDVHLVDINGGPQDVLVGFPLGGVSAIAGPWVIPTPIVMCESGGRNLPPNSAGASGYYQIIPSTWALYGGPGPAAYLAPKSVQDMIAARIWNGGAGASQWDCSKLVNWT